MSTPEDISRLKQLKETEPIQEAWDHWISTREVGVGRVHVQDFLRLMLMSSLQALRETSALLDDPDLRSMAAADYTMLTESLTDIVKKTFPSILVPPSRTSQLSALMEFKSGVGGSEASLFLGEMLRMYMRLAQVSRWKANIVTSNDLDAGGIKDAVVEFRGPGAYDALRWESGVHRVQRVPATDQSGRVHTSAVAVMVIILLSCCGAGT